MVRLQTAILALAATANAVFNPHFDRAARNIGAMPRKPVFKKESSTAGSPYLNNQTQKFVVDGTKIPLYPDDLGESYAGLIPIAKKYSMAPSEDRELFFWFFPSDNADAGDEIAIWLTGGPGCSSLVAMLEENGPMVWVPGTEGPMPNPWGFSRLTNIVYVEFPVGVGYTQGQPGLYTNNTQTAMEFLGFWKNFVDAFELHGRKIFITGESYAGYYIPYIADAMLNKKNTKYFNVEATMLYDPVIGVVDSQQQIPSLTMAKQFKPLLPVGDDAWAAAEAADAACGYTAFLDEWLKFPAKGIQPPSSLSTDLNGTCDVYFYLVNAVWNMNPCFYPYMITEHCPFIVDAIRNPPVGGDIYYGGDGYFGRDDVKAAINAPDVSWTYCTFLPTYENNTDLTVPPAFSVLPGVIERSKRTVIHGGTLDWSLPSNGTLLAIQNMTWGGKLGFEKKPADQFYVPYVDVSQDGMSDGNPASIAGTTYMGITTTERGLTWVDTYLAGHQGPSWQPAAAFRHFEFLLGRVANLTTQEGFTVTISDL